MSNEIAPRGAVFVCQACGKRSRDIYGYQKISPGWDESCAINSVLLKEGSLVMNGDTVIAGQPWIDEKDRIPAGG